MESDDGWAPTSEVIGNRPVHAQTCMEHARDLFQTPRSEFGRVRVPRDGSRSAQGTSVQSLPFRDEPQLSVTLRSICNDATVLSRVGSTVLAVSIEEIGTLDACTYSWKLGSVQTSRQILDWTWDVDPGVCAANRGTVS